MLNRRISIAKNRKKEDGMTEIFMYKIKYFNVQILNIKY